MVRVSLTYSVANGKGEGTHDMRGNLVESDRLCPVTPRRRNDTELNGLPSKKETYAIHPEWIGGLCYASFCGESP